MTSRAAVTAVVTASTLAVVTVGAWLAYGAVPMYPVGLSPRAAESKTESVREQTPFSFDPVVLSAAHRKRLTRAQEALRKRGYDSGSADGVLDSRTAASLRDFQRDQGIPMTGQATAETLVRLGVEVPPSRLKRRQ